MCKNVDHFLAKLVSLKATRLLELNEVVTPLNKAKCVDDVTIWPFNVFSRNVIKKNTRETKQNYNLDVLKMKTTPKKKKFPFIFAA